MFMSFTSLAAATSMNNSYDSDNETTNQTKDN